MLKTNLLKPIDISLHLKTMAARFDAGVKAWPTPYGSDYPAFTKDLMEILIRQRDSILIGDAKQLWHVIDELEAVAPNFHLYLKKRPGPKSKKRLPEFENLIIKLESLFNYKKFIEKKGSWNAYKLVDRHNLRICPYCQLHHINYHHSGVKGALELRPPLDHFLPKSRYPYLAVSLKNLVPCCHQCNSSIKLDTDPGRGMPNPFDTSTTLNISFHVHRSTITPQTLNIEDLTLHVKGIGSWINYEAFFRLNERYQWYLPEIYDMFNRISEFSEYDETMRSLLNKTPYILGFHRTDAPKRTLGLCLVAIAEFEGAI
ncbi:hypothetical protein [Pseudomonas sp. RGM 3321]|uniref:HNH endonuclease n=1 Tax=Pseudomonas sp. RGM 3321 TaxID=2930089 RepID=UPI001FCAA51B|nr:hypothetical protein [Pseudomonas sp. RGM 3321]MCJ2372305.1 hypothetical protein [Pseudomonas sp. RGM 3321]